LTNKLRATHQSTGRDRFQVSASFFLTAAHPSRANSVPLAMVVRISALDQRMKQRVSAQTADPSRLNPAYLPTIYSSADRPCVLSITAMFAVAS